MKQYEIKINSILQSENKFGYFPKYIFEDDTVKINAICYFYYKFILNIFKFLLKWRLKISGSSYKKYKNDLSNQDVENIYTREAKDYERKHHLTTNFRDTWWRRQAAIEIINYIKINKKESEPINVLDIGTGMGLSLEETLKIFKLFNLKINGIGLDYNEKMLKQAQQITLPRILGGGLLEKGVREIKFIRGDARNLTKRSEKRLGYFGKNSFDCIILIFGIGGIDFALESIKEQLTVLKPNGVLIITDIHRPIFKLNEKWPWFISKKNADAFAIMAWENITKPLVLTTLWGWKDPTPFFYLASLIVYFDKEENNYYSFEQISFFLDNEFWWFGLPVMPTAKIVLKKSKISKIEFYKKEKILNQILFHENAH